MLEELGLDNCDEASTSTEFALVFGVKLPPAGLVLELGLFWLSLLLGII
jgi:hypothetical protein